MEAKERGNLLFKAGAFDEARQSYTEAIAASDDRELACALYSNRAACHLKLSMHAEAVADCDVILGLHAAHPKALYRRGQARFLRSEYSLAMADLKRLLQIDPRNAEALELMRQLRTRVEKEQLGKSEVQNCLQALAQADGLKRAEQLLKALVGLCADEASAAAELLRSEAGLKSVSGFWNDFPQLVLTVMTCLASHPGFLPHVRLPCAARSHPLSSSSSRSSSSPFSSSSSSTSSLPSSSSSSSCRVVELEPGDDEVEDDSDPATTGTLLDKAGKLRLAFVCGGCSHGDADVMQAAVCLVMRILKSAPLGRDTDASSSTPQQPFFDEGAIKCVLVGFSRGLSRPGGCPPEVFSFITDAVSSLLSDLPDFITPEKPTDDRLEGLEERKARMARVGLIRRRVKLHAQWLCEAGALDVLVDHLDMGDAAGNDDGPLAEFKSKRASTCLGRVVVALDSDGAGQEAIKAHLLSRGYIPGDAQPESGVLPSIEQCRRRAALTAALYIPQPELGSWALSQPQGVSQLLLLIATGDQRCQDVAAEVTCLAAATDSGSGLLASILDSGALRTLMQSPNSSTRAAAASTMTKLSIKAKALTEESPEMAQILNTAFDVLKMAGATSAVAAASPPDGSARPVPFSVFDEMSAADKSKNKKKDGGVDKAFLTSPPTTVERAVEIIASLIGRTHIKEEVVHGSFRLTPSVQALIGADVDERSTAAYGIAHILASITVTNGELRAKALAEKDMTVEQYEQLSELQRIKTTDEKTGEVIEERVEARDTDTEAMCLLRIKRLATGGTIPFLVRLLAKGSARAKESAARALRQICVEDSARGLVVQHGGLKACCSVAMEEATARDCRREAAHAVAKTLVTTNPNMLSEHARVGAIPPLLMLCKDVDASSLQQFEALLALTNILSCGATEQDRFCSERGVTAVHYLIFNDHRMVRRAACEVFCNISLHQDTLRLLRQPEKVRLWLGLCEDWDGGGGEDQPGGSPHEAFLTARAAAGTLAVAVEDEQVCQALVEEKCARSLLRLFESENPELVHRALVCVGGLARGGAAQYLSEGNMLPALTVIAKIVPSLGDVAIQTSKLLVAELAKQ